MLDNHLFGGFMLVACLRPYNAPVRMVVIFIGTSSCWRHWRTDPKHLDQQRFEGSKGLARRPAGRPIVQARSEGWIGAATQESDEPCHHTSGSAAAARGEAQELSNFWQEQSINQQLRGVCRHKTMTLLLQNNDIFSQLEGTGFYLELYFFISIWTSKCRGSCNVSYFNSLCSLLWRPWKEMKGRLLCGIGNNYVVYH